MGETTKRGRVMITGAVARGRYLGRVCVLSFRTHRAEIDALLDDLAASLRHIVPERQAR
jgi:aromatic-L-amino-acid decarboxylase